MLADPVRTGLSELRASLDASILAMSAWALLILTSAGVILFAGLGTGTEVAPEARAARMLVGSGLALVSVCVLLLLQRGKVRMAATVFVGAIVFLIVGGVVWLDVGVHSPSLPILAVAIMVAGFMLDTAAGVALTIFAASLTVGLLVAEQFGFIDGPTPGTEAKPFFLAFVHSLLFLLVGWLSLRYAELFRRAINEEATARLALQESQRQLRAILDNEPDSVELVSPSGRILQINPAGLAIIEADRVEQAVGLDVESLVAPASKSAYAVFRHALLSGRPESLEFEIVGLKGSHRWLDTNAVPLCNAQGELTFVLGISRDVTLRRQTADQLLEAKQRYELLASGTFEGIAVTERGQFVDANNRLLEMLGYSRNELIGMRVEDLLPEEDRERVLTNIRIGRESHLEHDMLHRAGHVVCVEAHGQTMKAAGRDIRITALRDITGRKHAERQLEAERERLRDFSKSTADWFWEMDAELRFSYFSENFETAYGFHPDTILGRTRTELFVRDDLNSRESIDSHVRHLQQHEPFRDFEYRLRDPNGKEHWISVSGVPVHDRAGKFMGYRGVARIVSDRKALEFELDAHRRDLEKLVARRTEELNRAKEAAEAGNLAKTAFLANMSHEMRTPLHHIAGMSSLIRMEPLTAKQLDRLDKLDAARSGLTALIDEVLHLSDLEAIQVASNDTEFDLGALAKSSLENVRTAAENKNIALHLHIDTGPLRVCGDEAHIKLALGNYLTNAVRFTSAGDVSLRVRIEKEDASFALIRFEVEDTGIGIAPKDVQRLFNLFEQVDNSQTRQCGGLGAGLAMTRKIARRLGGDTGCDSVEGQGSLFWLTARLAKCASQTNQRPDALDQGPRIFSVDQ